MSWDWVKEFAEAATGKPAEVAPQLSPLGHTRAQLLEQLASASAQPQTPVVKQYIAEARRRLEAL